MEAVDLQTLIEAFELTYSEPFSQAIADARGMIMDELERRNPEAFETWIFSTEDSPREFFD